MHATTVGRAETPPTVPESIDSPRAKLVYVYLAQEREATVDALAEALDIRKLGLFDVVATLEADGHVERDGPEAVAIAD